MPEADEGVLERLTGGHVEEADVEPQRHTILVLRHVLTEDLGEGPDVGTRSDFGREDTGVVLCKVTS